MIQETRGQTSMGKALSAFVLICLTSIGWPATAQAGPVVLSEGAVDLALSFDRPNRAWDLVASADAGSFPVSQVQFLLNSNTVQTQPADPRFAFTGASPGNPMWIFPQQTINSIGTVFLSINGIDGLHPQDFAAYASSDPRVKSAGSQKWITISLESVTGSGPDKGGQFSLWQTGVFGNPVLWMSTFDNPNPNTLYELAGTELHFNWGFSAPGEYDVTFQASGFLGPGQTDPTVSDDFTVHFVVPPQSVPEPTTLSLLSLGGLILMAVHRRRCRRGNRPAEAAG
jgi:surface-anchored protein